MQLCLDHFFWLPLWPRVGAGLVPLCAGRGVEAPDGASSDARIDAGDGADRIAGGAHGLRRPRAPEGRRGAVDEERIRIESPEVREWVSDAEIQLGSPAP